MLKVDPAIDHPGIRFHTFLTNAIAELKARDMDTPQTTALNPVPATPAAKPAAPPNKFNQIAQKLGAVHKKMDARADRLLGRIGAFDEKVDSTFDKQEERVAQGEQTMDMLDAQLASVGNEENPNG